MADIIPTQLFPNYAYLESGTATPSDGVFIPLSDLPQLSAGEADAATGDGREVARALVDTATDAIRSLADADKPTKMSVTKGNPQGIGIDQIRQSYTITFDLVVNGDTGVDMVSEG